MDEVCRLDWFAERDIDVWLAEELRVNENLARWFLRRVEAPETVVVPACETRVSVVNGRETDVEAIFTTSDGRRFGLLIEDKIKADFQPDQMQDYFKRGEAGKSEGKWSNFAILIFAPDYRMHMAEISAGAKLATFNEVSNFLKCCLPNDLRAIYRAEFLLRAARPRTVVARDVSDLTVKWWDAANELIRKQVGDFLPPQAPTVDSYVSPRWAGQPSFLRLDIKGHKGEVALALKGVREDMARGLLTSCDSVGLSVVKRAGWKDPAIVVTGGFAKYEVGDNFSEASEGVVAAYAGAYRLYQFWQSNRNAFEILSLDNLRS